MQWDDHVWSPEQWRAIAARGHNVLVSAGAGSGKTSVLVERVVRLVAGDNPVDLDRLLVVTFTEAAAAEMRTRIAARLQALLEVARKSRDNQAVRRLSRQLALLDQSQISTLHSFCMEIVRRNFLPLGLEPAFSILAEDEASILRRELFEALAEEWLQGPEADAFRSMLARFQARDPLRLRDLVFRLDEFSRGQEDPVGWLRGVAGAYTQAEDTAFRDLPWTSAFCEWLLRQLEYAEELSNQALQLASPHEELKAYADNLASLVTALAAARLALSGGGLEAALPHLRAVQSALTARVRAKAHENRDIVKRLRDGAKKALLTALTVATRGEAALKQDIVEMAPQVVTLMRFVESFQTRYDEWKRRRQALDFNDLEHLALRVLKDPESGEAERLRNHFAEVFVDEYQDTSPIQDALVTAIARPQGNVFVVGDVKQSIYRFRMAEPRLFLHKYQTLGRDEPGEVIDLTTNYRSRREVVDAVNFLFMQLFSPVLGGLTYDDPAWMRAGAEYPLPAGQKHRTHSEALEPDGAQDATAGSAPVAMDGTASDECTPTLAGPVEVHLLEREMTMESAPRAAVPEAGVPGEEPTGTVSDMDDPGMGDSYLVSGDAVAGGHVDPSLSTDTGSSARANGNGDDLSAEELTALELEATVIARRIQELMGIVEGCQRHQVWDAKARCYRPLAFRDIVILMRSVRGRTATVLDVLHRHGIPAYGATSTGFFGALEIQWLHSALAAIDNPRREIELVALLRSPLAGFSDAELAQIRLFSPGNFYDALRKAAAAASGADDTADADETHVPDTAAVRDGTEPQKASPPLTPTLPQSLATRLNEFWRRFQAWRQSARREGAEALIRRVLTDTDFVSYLLAMPAGETRRANVEQLIDRAREFDRASVDGVFGFVRRLHETVRHQLDAGEARTLAAGEDVVRVMTIHQSKGLEFPVVFVADLGKQFHQDWQERAYPLHADLGFGPQFVDLAGHRRWLTMPSIALQEANRREFLAEEARILYVALTRARERLILVGSAKGLSRKIQTAIAHLHPTERTLPAQTLVGARSYLDWLLPALARHRDGKALWSAAALAGDSVVGQANLASPDAADTDTSQADAWVDDARAPVAVRPQAGVYDHPARFRVQLWNLSVPGAREIPQSPQSETNGTVQAERGWSDFAAFERWLEEHSDAATQDWVAQALSAAAQERPLVDVPGKVSATDLRRLWVARAESPSASSRSRLGLGAAERLLEEPRFIRAGRLSARASGSAYHAVMQHLDLNLPPTREHVQAALDELLRTHRISPEEREAVAVEDVLGFLQSPLGRRLAKARRVWREQPFFSRLDLTTSLAGPASKPAGSTGWESSEPEPSSQMLMGIVKAASVSPRFVVVQGVIDCLAEEESGWLVIDYKTDQIPADRVRAQAAEYAAQVAAYLRVVRSFAGDRPVTAYLYFVKPQVAVAMDDVDLAEIFR
jgi:ATP-dependent helicase/nuclease subunit A